MILSRRARLISCQPNTGKNGITIRLQAQLPSKKPLLKADYGKRQTTTVYVGLTAEQANKLKEMARRKGSSESAALREVLAGYLAEVGKRGLSYQPYRKTSPDARKVKPRTISREQDKALRELAEKTGRSISELVREAGESWFEKKHLE